MTKQQLELAQRPWDDLDARPRLRRRLQSRIQQAPQSPDPQSTQIAEWNAIPDKGAHSKQFTTCPITGTENAWFEYEANGSWFGRNVFTPGINTIDAQDYGALRREYQRMTMLRHGVIDPNSQVVDQIPNEAGAGGILPATVLIG